MTANGSTGATRRISPVRLVLLVLALVALAAAGSRWALNVVAQSRVQPADTWFAPYVDVTLTPTLHFEDPAEQPSGNVVLGFVVADPGQACEPSWGTYYSLDAAARALDLDRRVVRLHERGGSAIVSFGGALNSELATACTDVDKLTAAYQSVITRYGLKTIDFDIEGASLADTAANARRAAAIQRLQRDNPGLAVWLTLPVAPQGLTAESVALVDQALASGVDLAGINVMTMNYGGSRPTGMSMRDATIAAITATWQQLDGAYQRAGAPRTAKELWKMVGATPMIGQNDVAEDVFRQGDADGLMAFARTVDLGRVSLWSANRDVQCGAVVTDVRVSNTCSGIDQEPLEFAKIFGSSSKSSKPAVAEATASPEGGDAARADALMRDDPRTSPYPPWRSPKAYEEGAKVVWQGRVYQAKWWTQGDQPDAPIKQVWETPWRYLGPVLESDRDAIRAGTTVSDGNWPRWAAEKVYIAGDTVQLDNKVFRAKWWTQGDVPQEDPDRPFDHPWEYIGKVDPAPK